MTKCYPDTIPEAWRSDASLADAYRLGWNHGHGIACHNVPRLGETYWTDANGRQTADADNIRDLHQDLCFAAADNARSYSPFEFTAHAFNEAGEGDDDHPGSDELWEAFEAGECEAILADLATYDDDDYGLGEEEAA